MCHQFVSEESEMWGAENGTDVLISELLLFLPHGRASRAITLLPHLFS